MIKRLLCWCLLAFVVVSCEESFVSPDPEARGLNYYPLAVGEYRIYDVTDIKYQHNEPTEVRFQMREWVADSFLDQTNALTYKIIRSVRPDAQSEWLDDSVMTVTKSNSSVILTKDNTRYVKLVFPVVEGKSWVADAFNDHIGDNNEQERHTYISVDKPYTLDNDMAFENTLVVQQGDPRVDVIFDDRKEVYARNVGRIYRQFIRLKYDECPTTDCEEKPILSGHERHEILLEHGKL